MTAVQLPGRLTLENSEQGTTVILSAAGEIDLATSPAIVTRGHDAIRSGAAELRIDLTGVTFMDSSGIAALLELRRFADRHEARLVVVCPEGAPRRAIELTGVGQHIGVVG